MPQIHFHVSEAQIKALTWEDYEAIERAQDGDLKLYLLRPMLARFVVDEENKPLEQGHALKLLAAVSLDEIPGIIQGFMDVLRERAIPKASGNSS